MYQMHIRTSTSKTNLYASYLRGGDPRLIPPSWPKFSSSNQTVTLEKRRETSSGHRDWKKLIAEGKEATTYLFGRSDSQEQHPGVWNLSATVRVKISGVWVYLPLTEKVQGLPYTGFARVPQAIVPLGSTAEQRAAKSYLSKIREEQTRFSGMVFIGELRETLRMLRSPAKALFESARTDYLDALLRVKRRRGRQWTKAIAGTYLEWVFGVQPLLNDLRDAADALDQIMDKDDVRKHIVGVGDFITNSNTAFSSFGPWFLNFKGSSYTYMKEKVKYRGLYQVKKTGPEAQTELARNQASLGITLREFVPTLWELMPWSFLIDYGINIGDVLEATYTNTADVKWTVKTTIRETLIYDLIAVDVPTTRGRVAAYGQIGAFSVDDVCAVTSTSRKEVVRDSSAPPTLNLEARLPGLGSQKWLNVSALIAQADLLYPQRRGAKR